MGIFATLSLVLDLAVIGIMKCKKLRSKRQIHRLVSTGEGNQETKISGKQGRERPKIRSKREKKRERKRANVVEIMVFCYGFEVRYSVRDR